MYQKLIEYFNGKSILILGFGKEGQSTYNFIRRFYPEKKIAVADKRELKIDDSNVTLITGEKYLDAINDFDIVIIQSSFDSKYGAIGHRNVLGTIMSLGIERNTFGDIVVTDDTITIFATKEISSYLIKNLTMISHQPMKWKIIDEFIQNKKNS
jgi:RNA-binding protein YlmH